MTDNDDMDVDVGSTQKNYSGFKGSTAETCKNNRTIYQRLTQEQQSKVKEYRKSLMYMSKHKIDTELKFLEQHVPSAKDPSRNNDFKFAKLETIQEELEIRNSLKRKTLDNPSYPEAKMHKNSATITTSEEQTTYEHKLAEQEKQTEQSKRSKRMRFGS